MDYLLEASPPCTGNAFSHVANPAACILSARLHFAIEIVLSVAQLQFSLSKHLGAADHCTTPAVQGFCVYHQLDFSRYSNFALEELLCLLSAKHFAKVPLSAPCSSPTGSSVLEDKAGTPSPMSPKKEQVEKAIPSNLSCNSACPEGQHEHHEIFTQLHPLQLFNSSFHIQQGISICFINLLYFDRSDT